MAGSSRRWQIVLVSILLLPLLVINVKDSHDWGDDFAQYLIQSRNIVEGRLQTDNGLVMNPGEKEYAIKAYPIGMPLLLAPLYSIYQLRILPYDILISVILFLTGILCFIFLRNRIHFLTAILITFLYCYSPHIIDFKKYILSEIPFTCLVLGFLIWQERKKRYTYAWLVSGILLFALTSMRLAGFAVVVGYVFHELFSKNDSQVHSKQFVKETLPSVILSFLLFYLVNELVFKIDVGHLLGFYSGSFTDHEFKGISNISFNYQLMNFVFPFFGKTIGSWWVLISLAGWILHLIQKRSLIDFIFFFYSVLILIYPYTDGGLRFIFPMLPFLIYYLCFFFAYLFYKFQFGSIILNTLLILLISAYFSPLKQIIASSGLIEKGPYEKQSVELFNFLKTTSKSSVIVFCKARAISLYSERSSLYPAKDQIESKTLIQFKRHENLFVVISKDKNNEEIFDPLIIQYIHDHRDNYVLAWENEFFIVMKQVKNFKSGLASQEVL